MDRFTRVVAVDIPHHVTQRGNARQVILECDENRVTFLALLRQHSEVHGLGQGWADSAVFPDWEK